MKKMRVVVLAALLAVALSIPMALPAAACSGASTFLTIDASATEVAPGDTVILTIVETNDGAEWSQWRDLKDAYVELEPLGLVLDNTSSEYGFASNLADPALANDPHLDWGEVWQWQVPVEVNDDMTFVAIGHGYSKDYMHDITYDPSAVEGDFNVHDPEERAEVTVFVTPPDGEGFTPGFWKNHPDAWPTGYVPYDPDATYFDEVFEVGPHITLMAALSTGGGGENALLRHASAAILNAEHPDVDYSIAVAEIIAAVQVAYDSGDYEPLKDQLDEYNNMGGDM
jgi:hypothetical protein